MIEVEEWVRLIEAARRVDLETAPSVQPTQLESEILMDDLHDSFGCIQSWRFTLALVIHMMTGDQVEGYERNGHVLNRSEDDIAFTVLAMIRDGETDLDEIKSLLETLDQLRIIAAEEGWEY